MSPSISTPGALVGSVVGRARDAVGGLGGLVGRNGAGSAGDTAQDRGYFPPGSILRRVMSERVVGLHYGQRALVTGALWPPPLIGTIRRSNATKRPFERLARTGKSFQIVYFGTRAEADAELARVHRLHSRVNGEFDSEQGIYPQGTRYDAYDPEQMLWTMGVIADSAVYFYELLVGSLSDEEKEEIWAEWVRFGELFGMPAKIAPESWTGFREWMEGMLASEKMYLGEEARRIGYATGFQIPFPDWQIVAKPLHDALIRGSLPPRARELYGLSWTPADRAAFRVAVTAVKAARLATPPPLRRGPVTALYDGVANTERRRIADGKPTPRAA